MATVLVALGFLSLAFRSQSTLFENPLTEDGYYVLSVARQIALGHGITIDGQQLTNGFQPLFAFLLVPIYAAYGDDRYSSLRGVLAFHWAIHVTTAVLLGFIVKTSLRSQGTERSTIGFWATAFLWLASRYVLLNSYNGLETGCTLLLYALAWRLYQLNWLDGWRLIGLSSVLGLLILARIDAIIFVATLATFELFRWNTPLQLRFRRAVAIASISFTISLPWWLYNLLFFGSLMPSSGTAQAAPFSFARVGPMVSSVLQVLAPYIQIRWIEGLPQMILQACVVLIIAMLFVKTAFSDMKTTNAFRIGSVITISTAILGLYYLFFSGAPHFYGRYLSPFMLISIVLAAITLAQVDRFRNLIRFAVLISLVLIAAASILGYQFQVGVSKSPFYNDQLQLIEVSVPRSETVSAGQSGTIGYFRDHVVNLDGKVNAEALHYRNNMWKYLENRNIAWYCDWSSGFLGPDPAANGWTMVGRRGSFLLYHHPSTHVNK